MKICIRWRKCFKCCLILPEEVFVQDICRVCEREQIAWKKCNRCFLILPEEVFVHNICRVCERERRQKCRRGERRRGERRRGERREESRRRRARDVEKITDRYISKLTKISIENLRQYPNLIEFRRAQILLNRAIKEAKP